VNKFDLNPSYLEERVMDQSDDPQELERKIEQAARIASRVTDQTTVERLRAWIEELKYRLRQRLQARRTKQAISARAREIWEQNGRPAGRDLEFWLQAESEISERHRH
jgi:predicted RNA-binding Zn ribbon-like protein